ncbi:hypothetical protein QE152_g14406 [Popillia japonica]|uniref:Uncharacterized protein n=1 Tax=Popillia japonica TaxID=7064 RepID=A0AAW1L8U2_POPJA
MSEQKKRRVEYSRDPNGEMEWYILLSSDESDNDDESDPNEEDHIEENLYDSNSEQEEEAGDIQNEVIDRDMPCLTDQASSDKLLGIPYWFQN